MFDVQAIRRDFPFLASLSNKKPLVYLDSAASAAKPQGVIDAELEYYRDYGVNIHRGLYEASAKATRKYHESREAVARFIGARDPRTVIFTHGSTESSNLLAYSWSRKNLHPGDRVISTQLEHHSTLVPWQEACKRQGGTLSFIPYDSESGSLNLTHLAEILSGAKALVITGMSNATGYKLPLDIIIPQARKHGLCIIIDGAQLVAHGSVNVETLDCDFLYFSAHKLLGPTGLGILYGKISALEQLDPFLFGGDMIETVGDFESTWAGIPEKFEAGTPHIAGAIAFAKALEYLENLGMEELEKHEGALRSYTLEKLGTLPYVDIYGPRDASKTGGVVSFNIHNVHSHDTATILDSQGVAVRAGFHCAMPYLRLLGQTGTVRASFHCYTSFQDIDALVLGLQQAYKLFARG